MKRPVLIAGPTASGKSALALAIAERHAGVILNADSMQVYRELRILTARPSEGEEARAKHLLYGHVPASEAYSVARWLEDVRVALEEVRSRDLRAIIVGGTGLYFKALTEGLSPIPEIGADIRSKWRGFARRHGAAGLAAELRARDPAMAATLRPTDTQRMTRALEVIEATGRSLAEWQLVPGHPILPLGATLPLVALPSRADLYERAERRFEQMMAAGAEAEVARLRGLGLDRSLPIFGALGLGAILDYLEGRLTREAAIARGKQQTRHYVKRQETWAKSHMMSWNNVQTNIDCNFWSDFDRLIDD